MDSETVHQAHAICDRCLGRRIMGARGEEQIRVGAERRAADGAPEVNPADCPVCENAFADFETWVDLAEEALGAFEFQTFQVGTLFPKACEQLEKSIVLNPEIGDTIRTEANRLLGPAIAHRMGKDWSIDGRPDAVVQVDTRFWSAEVRTNSIFMEGRYTKFRRDIPQTHWPCKTCQGTGCYQCEDSGVQYAESVEETIGNAALPLFGGEKYSFHGAGREDIDALMLGTGRPFVLEIHVPRRQTIDFAALEAAINAETETTGVGVNSLRMTEKPRVAEIKDGGYDKEYLAHCVTEAPITKDVVLAACESMHGQVLQQRTPERVAHRRADLVRPRTVHHILLEEFTDEHHFSVRVLAESGTYIKEMINGDDGRTEPSFAERCGLPMKVEYLDVVAILDDAESS
ncbi:MAG: tRNA pseudouridine(54/55) synthase Pus10 [Thermoplasmatota archaeon]